MHKEIVKSDIKNELKEGVTLLNFHATWCGPCKMLMPVLKGVAGEYGDKINVLHVDVDKDREFAREMEVQGTPTTFIYKDGEVVKKVVGYTGKETWTNIVDQLI
ncbi:thioredoxin [Mycoplasma testudineum]|uniref:Thioredoxin n=1 Tax=Mycoplasma testudineum TaxID=244584 RepID=A0A4R6IEU1_9MOLU|nr:thioredoxin family protein [Mycoplasma testudineum]OYD26955.1 thiol reductase thioredoxin [Mycoplasma testudineum]TDO20504.1 thioredoxin [Mycoplasma testudineum]